MQSALLSTLFVFVGAFTSCGRVQEEPSPLKAYFEATDEKGRTEAIDRLCANGAQALDIERLLRIGRAYSKNVPTGWQALEIAGS